MRSPLRVRRGLAFALLVVLVALAWDLARPPAEQGSARSLLAAIGLYRRTLSPALGGLGVECRFFPSCSRYAEVAIRRHGAWRGSWLALRRIARCGPWTPRFTTDPVQVPATLR